MSHYQLLKTTNFIEEPTIATIGTFDGVHLGHQSLLRKVSDEAIRREARSVAFVFKEQPRTIIKPSEQVTYLSDFESRLSALATMGIDDIVQLEFNQTIQKLSSIEFVSALREQIHLASLVLGPGAMIGADRAGFQQLSTQTIHSKIDFIDVPPVVIDGEPVSSSVIRIAVVSGNCELAAKMLGRYYEITGEVTHGKKRGSEIGFPTANIESKFPVAIPENGIYATLAEVDGEIYQASTSIGVRPTFETDGCRTIESHLLNFNGDLYSKRIRLQFVKRLRSEVKFKSIKQLIEQMDKDVEQTRKLLSDV